MNDMRKLMDKVVDLGGTDALFEMANLSPRSTGLPMTVFVSPKGGARHDARVKVSMSHGDTMNIQKTAVVGIRPASLLHGELAARDRVAVFAWIDKNKEALLSYWEGAIDTVELVAALAKI